MCLLLFLPAAGASCPHRLLCLLQMEGGEEQQRKGVGEADWWRWGRWGSAGPWSPLPEPRLTQKQQQQETLVKQWSLFSVFLFMGCWCWMWGGRATYWLCIWYSRNSGFSKQDIKWLGQNILCIKPKYQRAWISSHSLPWDWKSLAECKQPKTLQLQSRVPRLLTMQIRIL